MEKRKEKVQPLEVELSKSKRRGINLLWPNTYLAGRCTEWWGLCFTFRPACTVTHRVKNKWTKPALHPDTVRRSKWCPRAQPVAFNVFCHHVIS